MSLYKFETDQFGLSDTGIHLLRSGYNYETIEMTTIDRIQIEKGRQVKNWLLLLIFGLAFSTFGLFTAIKVIYEYFFANNFTHFYLEQFLIPIFPLFIGVLSVYFSFKIGPVLLINLKDKIKRFPIGQQKNKPHIRGLIYYLSNNELTKNKFTLNYFVSD